MLLENLEVSGNTQKKTLCYCFHFQIIWMVFSCNNNLFSQENHLRNFEYERESKGKNDHKRAHNKRGFALLPFAIYVVWCGLLFCSVRFVTTSESPTSCIMLLQLWFSDVYRFYLVTSVDIHIFIDYNLLLDLFTFVFVFGKL